MTFTDAAREVLRLVGRPLHYKEITELAIEKNLLSHVGKSPEVTMGARLAATLKKEGNDNPLVRVKPGVFALREWGDDKLRTPPEAKSSAPEAEPSDDEPDVVEVTDFDAPDDEAVPVEAAPAAPQPRRGERRPAPVVAADQELPAPGTGNGAAHKARALAAVDDEFERLPDEELRADLAAGASELFAEEDDDDQPILQRVNEADDNGETGPDGRRRRRRRRRRGARPGEGPAPAVTAEGLPSYTTTPAFGAEALDEQPAQRGPQVIELVGESGSLDGLAGRELSDAVAAILATFDRTVGPVSLRQIAETALRRGRLNGEPQLAQSQIAAAVRADNGRRASLGMRPRFRLAGGRVGLTDWLLDGELARAERDVLTAVNRYRDAARRSFARKLGELPGHAFIELCMLVLERVGTSRLRSVKFPGTSGAEAHFSGILYAPAGPTGGAAGNGDGVKLAIVVRKDGRDIGRERVTELRGSMHHYGGAHMGWLITAGQALSGAREEASSGGTPPVVLVDGQGLARLCEDYGVAVVRAQHPIAIPDVDLFEALRAS